MSNNDLLDNIQDYLYKLGVSSTAYDRAKRIYSLSANLTSDVIEDIFITNREKDNKPEFDNMWLFTKSGAFEAHNFIQNTHIDYVMIKNRVVRWEIAFSKDFEFPTDLFKKYDSNPSLNGALYINFSLQNSIAGKLTAMGKNCSYAMNILKTYLIPNASKMTDNNLQKNMGKTKTISTD